MKKTLIVIATLGVIASGAAGADSLTLRIDDRGDRRMRVRPTSVTRIAPLVTASAATSPASTTARRASTH